MENQPDFDVEQYYAIHLDTRGYSTEENARLRRGLFRNQTNKFGGTGFEFYPVIYSSLNGEDIYNGEILQYENRFYRINKVVGKFSKNKSIIIDEDTKIKFNLNDFLI